MPAPPAADITWASLYHRRFGVAPRACGFTLNRFTVNGRPERTLGVERDAQPAPDGLPQEAPPARARAAAARPLGKGKPLSEVARGPEKRSGLCPARRPALRQRRSPPGHRHD